MTQQYGYEVKNLIGKHSWDLLPTLKKTNPLVEFKFFQYRSNPNNNTTSGSSLIIWSHVTPTLLDSSSLDSVHTSNPSMTSRGPPRSYS